MKKRIILMGLITLLSACEKVDTVESSPNGASTADTGGPPPMPPYQMREELGSGNRLAASSNGEAIYSNRCGSCHLPGGMGTNIVTVQQIKAGKPPENGLLTNRDDLTAEYVKQVVRNGKVAMPPISRVEVTDAELGAITTFLEKGT